MGEVSRLSALLEAIELFVLQSVEATLLKLTLSLLSNLNDFQPNRMLQTSQELLEESKTSHKALEEQSQAQALLLTFFRQHAACSKKVFRTVAAMACKMSAMDRPRLLKTNSEMSRRHSMRFSVLAAVLHSI